MKRFVSPEFNAFVMQKYPALATRKDYRNLFNYICFSANYDNDGELYLTYHLVAKLAEKSAEADNKNFSALDFLLAFKREVLPGFTFIAYDEKRYRRMKCDGLDNNTRIAIANELANILHRDDPAIHFSQQRKRTRRLTAETRSEIERDWIEESKLFNWNPTQQFIFDYLQPGSLDGRSFSRKMWENLPSIQDTIWTLPPKPTDRIPIQEKQIQQLKILNAINEDSRILYRPTPLGRTPRFAWSGECILSLSRPIRKAFCRGWAEIDLISSQFRIVSRILNAPLALDLIQNGTNLWEYLHGNKNYTANEKAIYKQLIYSFCFGKSRRNLKAICDLHNVSHILRSPMMVELLHLREQKFQEIKNNGGIDDVWGTFHCLAPAGIVKDQFGNKIMAKQRWEGSVFATLVQSIEMEIVKAIFEFASTRNDFRIMLFQHDGVCVSFDERCNRTRIIENIRSAVREAARKFNITADIESEQL